MARNIKLTKILNGSGVRAEQQLAGESASRQTHSGPHLHFHFIPLWPVALCKESIFLTPFPIYYRETAGRKGTYRLAECLSCPPADCTLHESADKAAVCFLFLRLWFIRKDYAGRLTWPRCDSRYASSPPSAHTHTHFHSLNNYFKKGRVMTLQRGD